MTLSSHGRHALRFITLFAVPAAAFLAVLAAAVVAVSWPGESSAATYTVTNTNNSGAGSLRDALTSAQGGASDLIKFNIPGCPPACTITPTTALPQITDDDTIIDATTQPGWAGVPLVVIDGSSAPASTTGLYVTGQRVVIQGLVINNFDAWGIRLSGSSDGYIRGNYLGTDPTGTVEQGNRFAGLALHNGSNANTIGGSSVEFRNVISGNDSQGISVLQSSNGNIIQGNYIGTNAAGTAAIENLDGILIQTSQNTIVGGSNPGEGNLMSGNTTNAVEASFDSDGSIIRGNLVGTNAQGTGPVPNGFEGIFLSSNVDNTTIGGTNPGDRNIISGNGRSGVRMFGSGNIIQGNYIGVDITGLVPLANGSDGVEMSSVGADNIIGGADPGAANVISGNDDYGVSMIGTGTGHVIQGNIIGFASDKVTPAGNGRSGINYGINNDNASVVIGGDGPGEGNLIGYSADSGLYIFGHPGNPISGNTIMYNFVGIETGTDATFTNNIVSHNGGPPVLGSSFDPPAGILIRGDSRDAVIQGNVITENTGSGVHIQGIGALIGGAGAGEGNVITANTGAGVFVDFSGPGDSSSPRDNTISANSIYANGGNGIDLAPDGQTQNDPMDDDVGANRRQNYPILTQATSGSLTVEGAINTRPQAIIRIEFFYTPECDPTGYGEGAEYLGYDDVTTDIDGNAPISSFLGSASLAPGSYVTATATHLGTHDTSEFSNCVLLDAPASTPTPTPTPTPPSATPTPTPTPVSSATPTPTPTSGAGTNVAWGDDDCNGAIAATDALKKLQDIASIPYSVEFGCPDIGSQYSVAPAGPASLLWGDTDCDGDYDAVDALQILRSIAGLSVNQQQGCPAIGESVIVGA